MHAIVHGADIRDRDGGVLLMATLFGLYPFLLKLYADGGYQGEQFKTALKKVIGSLNVEIIKRSDQAKGFVVLPNALCGTSHLVALNVKRDNVEGALLFADRTMRASDNEPQLRARDG
jgi:hypothetical protein